MIVKNLVEFHKVFLFLGSLFEEIKTSNMSTGRVIRIEKVNEFWVAMLIAFKNNNIPPSPYPDIEIEITETSAQELLQQMFEKGFFAKMEQQDTY